MSGGAALPPAASGSRAPAPKRKCRRPARFQALKRCSSLPVAGAAAITHLVDGRRSSLS